MRLFFPALVMFVCVLLLDNGQCRDLLQPFRTTEEDGRGTFAVRETSEPEGSSNGSALTESGRTVFPTRNATEESSGDDGPPPRIGVGRGDIAGGIGVVPSCEREEKTKYVHTAEDILDKVPGIQSWQTCCDLCRSIEEGCFSWTYNSKKEDCILLKATNYDKQQKRKFSSGTLL